MKLADLFEEFNPEVKKIIVVLKAWSKFNTPKIGTLKIPNRFKRVDEPYLYRGVRLDQEEIDTLQEKPLTLPSKGFSSWTENIDVAKKFAYGSGGTAVVYRKDSNKLDIFLNVDEFLFFHKIDPASVLHQTDEREVIVKDSTFSLEVTLDDIV